MNYADAGDDFGDDNAQFDIIIAADPRGHKHVYGHDPAGNRANRWIEEFVNANGTIPHPDRGPTRDVTDNGFMGLHVAFGGLFQKAAGMQEGEFQFASVFWNGFINAISVEGVMAVYDKSCGIDPERVACRQGQAMSGIFAVGINLGLMSQYLSSMFLKGGYMFYVERETGHLIGSSANNIVVNKQLADDSFVPLPASESQDTQVREGTRWVLSGDSGLSDGSGSRWSSVRPGSGQAKWGDETYFVTVVEYREFGLDWIGVVSVPWPNVMEDIESQKWRTLAIGMVFALAIKLFLQGLQKGLQMVIWRKHVIPSIDRAALKDMEEKQALAGGGEEKQEKSAPADAGLTTV